MRKCASMTKRERESYWRTTRVENMRKRWKQFWRDKLYIIAAINLDTHGRVYAIAVVRGHIVHIYKYTNGC